MRGRASISLNPGDPLSRRRSTRLLSNDINKNKELVNNINSNNNTIEEKPKESIEQNNNDNNNTINDKGEIVEEKKE